MSSNCTAVSARVKKDAGLFEVCRRCRGRVRGRFAETAIALGCRESYLPSTMAMAEPKR